MANHVEQNQRRNRHLMVRLTDHEHTRLLERSKRSGARTPSAYVRAAALTGREFEMPPWFHLRDLRNEVIRLTAAVQATPPGPTRDRALEAAIVALDRIISF